MIFRIFSMALTILISLHVQAQFSGAGAGTMADPYIITTPTQLGEMANDLTAHYRLGNDINMNGATSSTSGEFYNDGAGWEPLGEFTGVLDGNTRSITNLFINRPTTVEVGFISRTGTGAEIKNLGMEDVNITGGSQVGTIVGWVRLAGSISRCFTSGIVEANFVGGGLVGEIMDGTISESYSDVVVKADENSGNSSFAGGLVGILDGATVQNCYFTGSVRASGNRVGGIVGWNLDNATVTNTYALGYITGGTETGAIVGYNETGSTVSNSYFHLFGTDQTAGIGAGTTTGTTGLNDTEVLQQASYVGFDFTSTWTITEGQTTPSLQGNVPDPLPEPNTGPFLVGSGTELDPWQISTIQELNAIRDQELQGQRDYIPGYYILMNDLDLSTATGDAGGTYWNEGKGWLPIGANGTTSSLLFIGTFDGNNHKINGLTINRTEERYASLFARLGRFSSENGKIRNLNLENVDITGQDVTGSIAGSGDGTVEISNCFVSGNVNGRVNVGGIVGGSFNGKIINCQSNVNVTGTNQVGGIAGFLNGTIEESFSTGIVNGSSAVGGLAGYFTSGGGRIINSYSTSNVTGTLAGTAVGGLVGLMTEAGPDIIYSYATGTVENSVGFGNGAIGRGSRSVSSSNAVNIYFDLSSCSRLESFSPAKTLKSSEMVLAASFEGFDFTASGPWAIDEGNSYPYLKWQGADSSFNQPPGTIADPVPDVANLPDFTAQCSVSEISETPTATDACGKTLSGTTDAEFPFEGPGTYEITWTYSTPNGESASQTQNIVIADTEAPVADVNSLDTLRNACSIGSITAPTATDNCEGAITGTTDAVFPINAQDTTVVIWTYTDSVGNESTQEQIVIIADTVAPIPRLTELTKFTAVCEGQVLEADLPVPVASDNCRANFLSATTDAVFPITTAGETVITWSYDDGNGNISTETQTIFIPISSSSSVDTTICEGSDYTFPDGSQWDGVELTQLSTLQNSVGCDSLVTTKITVAPAPAVDLGPDTVVACVDDELSFGIDEANTDFTTYTITSLGGNSTDDSLTFVFDENLAGIARSQGASVQIELTDDAGCVGVDMVELVDNSIINWTPGIIDFSGDPTVVVSSAVIPENIDNFEWDFGDGTTNSTDVNPTHTYTENGEYEVTLTVSNECGDESRSNTINITGACSLSVPTVSQDGNVLSADVTGVSYQWIDCDTESMVPGATSQELRPGVSGNFRVEISDGTCTQTSECFSFQFDESILSIDKKSILVYPNPVSERLQIDAKQTKIDRIELIDISGKVIFEALSTESIDMSSFKQGIYFLNLYQDENKVTKKIIKH